MRLSTAFSPQDAHLDNGWACGDRVVGDGVVAARQHHVRLPRESLRNLDREATLHGRRLDKRRARDGDESGVDLLPLGALERIVLHVRQRQSLGPIHSICGDPPLRTWS